jgi:hypothetical protein
VRLAGLRGRNLELIEHRVLRKLAQAGVKLTGLEADRKEGHRLPEDVALSLGLLFRTLAPMRSRENMRAVAEGIEAMGHEEAAYWLGMAIHRKNPRRVLTALRYLMTDPAPSKPWPSAGFSRTPGPPILRPDKRQSLHHQNQSGVWPQ